MIQFESHCFNLFLFNCKLIDVVSLFDSDLVKSKLQSQIFVITVEKNIRKHVKNSETTYEPEVGLSQLIFAVQILT